MAWLTLNSLTNSPIEVVGIFFSILIFRDLRFIAVRRREYSVNFSSFTEYLLSSGLLHYVEMVNDESSIDELVESFEYVNLKTNHSLWF